MKKEQILEAFKTLSKGQGSYGRLLANLEDLEKNDLEQYEEVMRELEDQYFEDIVDLIMYIES